MTKRYLIFLGLLLHFNNICGQSTFSDSVFQKVHSGILVAFDSSFNPISIENFALLYSTLDTVQNDQWTRPRFIDNIFHSSIDGVVVENNPSFDTITYNSEFIAFIGWNTDRKGNRINDDRPIAFLIERNLHYQNPNTIKEIEFNKMLSNPKAFEKYNLLKNTVWKNYEISINNLPYKFDSCQHKYELKLNSDLTFNQSYEGKLNCSSLAMHPDIEVGVEDNGADFHKYSNEIQGCYIANPNGIWSIENEELILKNIYSKEIKRFRIINIDTYKMKLEYGKYSVELIKNI